MVNHIINQDIIEGRYDRDFSLFQPEGIIFNIQCHYIFNDHIFGFIVFLQGFKINSFLWKMDRLSFFVLGSVTEKLSVDVIAKPGQSDEANCADDQRRLLILIDIHY